VTHTTRLDGVGVSDLEPLLLDRRELLDDHVVNKTKTSGDNDGLDA
jgi:hypothetical protein